MISCILLIRSRAVLDEYVHKMFETAIKDGFTAYVTHFSGRVRYKDNLAFKPTEIWDLGLVVAA
jgi:hypothetical protein